MDIKETHRSRIGFPRVQPILFIPAILTKNTVSGCIQWQMLYQNTKYDGIVKSQKVRFPVIPAKAGIQSFQTPKNSLDSGFHRSDDFLRSSSMKC